MIWNRIDLPSIDNVALGYFARVTSLAEVREQVLKYVPVLSRPMVMYKKEHPVIWTPSYIDAAVSKVFLFMNFQQTYSSDYNQFCNTLYWG